MRILEHDIGTYLVESESRPEEDHSIDVAALTCSCEDFDFHIASGKHAGRRICKHLFATISDLGLRGGYHTPIRGGSPLLLSMKCPHGERPRDCLLC